MTIIQTHLKHIVLPISSYKPFLEWPIRYVFRRFLGGVTKLINKSSDNCTFISRLFTCLLSNECHQVGVWKIANQNELEECCEKNVSAIESRKIRPVSGNRSVFSRNTKNTQHFITSKVFNIPIDFTQRIRKSALIEVGAVIHCCCVVKNFSNKKIRSMCQPHLTGDLKSVTIWVIEI